MGFSFRWTPRCCIALWRPAEDNMCAERGRGLQWRGTGVQSEGDPWLDLQTPAGDLHRGKRGMKDLAQWEAGSMAMALVFPRFKALRLSFRISRPLSPRKTSLSSLATLELSDGRSWRTQDTLKSPSSTKQT